MSDSSETIYLGAGCFWCVEAVFQRLQGVTDVESGYTGGEVADPTYHQVCSGTTGHAEVCKVDFDPNSLQLEDLLEVFFHTHDPTTLNRQGADHGTQYRSAIFYSNATQQETAEQVKSRLDASGEFPNPIVTEITELSDYYSAEDYHQNYFNLNPMQGYCQMVIQPKLAKFLDRFGDRAV
ncbi:MAG: peptide-methionine (S)-S-oxide reductase [Planctomycetaceae bacterium]|nr:peptide-methionine (S)-S-oxide reductase [Planctomycetaceae bacterium]